MPRAAFSQIVNRSMSEVLTRSLITSLSTVFLIAVLLIFGGATLQDFAFAMMVGIASGTYSSIFIASPVLTAWKEREPAFARRRARIAEAMGRVPPSPERERRRQARRGRRRAEAEAAAEARSRGASRRPARAGARAAPPEARRSRSGARAATRAEPTAAEEPSAAQRRERKRAPRASSSASGASTGGTARWHCVVWFTMGIALWHFTVFLPDRFWQGIVGAFLGAVARRRGLRRDRAQIAVRRAVGETDLGDRADRGPGHGDRPRGRLRDRHRAPSSDARPSRPISSAFPPASPSGRCTGGSDAGASS